MGEIDQEAASRARHHYDTLYGYILGTNNPQVEKEMMLRHLNDLYENYIYRLAMTAAPSAGPNRSSQT